MKDQEFHALLRKHIEKKKNLGTSNPPVLEFPVIEKIGSKTPSFRTALIK